MPFEFKQDDVLPQVIHVIPKSLKIRVDGLPRRIGLMFLPRPELLDHLCRIIIPDQRTLGRSGAAFAGAPYAQGKLVRCVKGRILDVAVDVRRSSPNFGRAMSVELCADSGAQLFIPRGFAHGFCTLEDDTEVVYKTDAYYAPSHDYGIAHDDPAIAIDWPVPPHARILSDKDRALPSLADYLKLESIHEEKR